jgi:hypothetical protein
MSNVASFCMEDLRREYEEDVGIFVRNIKIQLEQEMNMETIVDNIESLGASKEKNITRCKILSDRHDEQEECENRIIRTTEDARKYVIDMLPKHM